MDAGVLSGGVAFSRGGGLVGDGSRRRRGGTRGYSEDGSRRGRGERRSEDHPFERSRGDGAVVRGGIAGAGPEGQLRATLPTREERTLPALGDLPRCAACESSGDGARSARSARPKVSGADTAERSFASSSPRFFGLRPARRFAKSSTRLTQRLTSSRASAPPSDASNARDASKSAACAGDIPRRRVAAPPRPRRGSSVETSRGAAATWIIRGGETRRRRDVDHLWRRVAAPPRPGT